jgi:hypothetical protein
MYNKSTRTSSTTSDAIGRHVVVTALAHSSESDRELLKHWAQQLLEIRSSHCSTYEKACRAIEVSVNSKAIWPFVKMVSSEVKRLGWDERGLRARIALAMLGPAALLVSSQGASIAALGGALGVPLWIVFGAGGAFAGVIIEEINSDSDQRHRSHDSTVGQVGR